MRKIFQELAEKDKQDNDPVYFEYKMFFHGKGPSSTLAYIEGSVTPNTNAAVIDELFVPNQERKRGVARELVSMLERSILLCHPATAIIKVESIPDAVGFYEKLGYMVKTTKHQTVLMVKKLR